MKDQITTDIRFSIVPESVLDSEISDRAVRLYAVLARYADNDTGQCFPSRETLAKRLNCHWRSVDRAIDELVKIGAITKTQRKTGKSYQSNLYTVRRVLTGVSEGTDTDVTRVLTPQSVGTDTGGNLTITTEQEPVKRKPVKRVISHSWKPKESVYSDKRYSVLDIDREVEAFRDWHLARGSKFADWDAAFRNWLKKGLDYQSERGYRESDRERSKRELDAWIAEQMEKGEKE